jgi:hypothetical protein
MQSTRFEFVINLRTAGRYGDLQGIAGRSLLEIDGLELPLLDGPAAADAAE